MITYKDLTTIHSLSLSHRSEQSPLHSYLTDRGVTIDQIERFSIGMTAPPMRDELQGKVSPYLLKWLDRNKILEHKLVFPIHDTLFRVGGLQTRGLEKKTFHKIYAAGSEALPNFMGLQNILPVLNGSKKVYLTEGIFDFFALEQIVPGCLCVTTASISQSQLKFLERFCSEVVVLFDMDVVGKKGAQKVQDYLKYHKVNVTLWDYPYKDLAEFRETEGDGKFREHFAPMIDLGSILNMFDFSSLG